MLLNEFKNGLEEHACQIQACIDSSQLHIRHEPELSYTVGFATLGLPELVITSMPLAQADELLRTLWTAARLCDITGRNWECLGKTLTPSPVFKPLADNERRIIFCDARTYYGHWDFKANVVSLAARSV
ncbi:DUF4262 domain-containing protein (plasmid) [Marinobacter sp. M3C]|jgi:hypothetical protein|uniref:DUF4262 domain-containing protein n=1 Tax=Marinobacter sp. M3C TaxID=2917715 RepID=UPI00200FB4D5|nr:DUF4262 domain-containing protein [Marinobacter sp. M3C]UQG62603.1 DUF4262 domain-containing protein [Marinobacter sp. M3C]